jgi:two-component system, cell cycle sensor histidine kinase and response regulator CckA
MNRVLVVDDEPVIRELLGYVLRSDDRDVLCLSTASDAIAKATQRAPIDVALVDKDLALGSGLDLVRRLKSLDPMTEVLLMTAHPSVDSVLEAVDAGASDYLPKPFDDIKQVVIRVKSAEQQSALRRERERLHAALRESEERYRKLFEGSPESVLVIDEETQTIVDVNEAATHLYARSKTGLVGQPVSVLRSTLRSPEPETTPERDAERLSIPPRLVERTDRRPDGTTVDVEASVGQFRLGGRLMTIQVIRDVGERLRASEERAKLEAQLRQAQKMEALGRLAGGVAHDFNNFLAVIMNYASFVADALRQGPSAARAARTQDDVEHILQAATSAASVTRQLLAFSRQEVIQPEVLDINVAVSEFEKMLRRALGEDVHLEPRLARAVRPVKIDRGQLEQVILNLAVNARDAMPGGGTITIATENRDADAGVGGEPHPRGTVLLSVADTGTGIDPDALDRIFDPFFTTKARGSGTGLGLATVKSIVETAGGFVRVATEKDRGTTFTVGLPACEAESNAMQSSPPAPSDEVGGTILLVEDDDAFRRGVLRMLAGTGYRVFEARGGAEALRIQEQNRGAIDLLLTDVGMPSMSGDELATQIREREPGIQVIFMSGYASKPVSRLSGELTAVAMLPKPFRETRLLAAVREAIDAARARNEGTT